MEARRLKLGAVFPGMFPMLLAVAWIAMVAMTLMDFAGFAAATKREAGTGGAAVHLLDRASPKPSPS